MTHLVIGHGFPLIGVYQTVLFFESRHNPFDCLLEFGHPHLFLVSSDGEERRFIDQVGEVRTCHTRGHVRQFLQVKVFCCFYVSQVNLQYLHSSGLIGAVHKDVAIEPAGSEECGVQNFRPVRCGHENNPYLRIETVHFRQKLI